MANVDFPGESATQAIYHNEWADLIEICESVWMKRVPAHAMRLR
jgi:hypothetical protein